MTFVSRASKGLSFLALSVVVTTVGVACAAQRTSTPGITGTAGTERREPARQSASASPQLQPAAAQTTSPAGGSEKDARYWRELTAVLQPVEMPSMRDHRAYMLPGGTVLALHHDNMDLAKAEHLNWVALGIPGKFCKADQERIDRQFGNGQGIFTHFHDMKNDTHGGQPGAEGVWLVHVAVREFDSPMGGTHVKPGPDKTFMPTPAPVC